MRYKSRIWRKLTAVILIASLTGCAVRPKPIAEAQFEVDAESNIGQLEKGQTPIADRIGLAEAMARAFKYNLELRMKQQQASLAKAELSLQQYSLFPKAVLNSGYVYRNNTQASSSLSLITNRRDSNSSTSQDREIYSNDITIGWDILDFGLSYIKAQQSSDEVLIARENWRGTLHKLMEEVRTQYWRASTYQRLIGRLKKLEKRANAALVISGRISRENQMNRLAALNSERELVKIKQAIIDLEQDLLSAKIELARLMNLKPGTEFALDLASRPHQHTKLQLSLDEILLLAASKRPELRKNAYEQRINIKEAQANLLKLFPSLRSYGSGNRNSNSFLINGDWVSLGASISWSLINVFQYPAKRSATMSKQRVLELQALNLTMAVVTQVYLARIRYDHFTEKLAMAEQFLSVQKRLTRQMRMEAKAFHISEQELIVEEMNELIAEAKYDIAQSELQQSYGELILSIGLEYNPSLDPEMPLDVMPLDVLAASLEEAWNTEIEPSVTSDLVTAEIQNVGN